MAGKHLNFYLIPSDLLPIVRQIEDSFLLEYFEIGLFDSVHSVSFGKTLEVYDDFGLAEAPDQEACKTILVLPISTPVNVREIPAPKGGQVKFAIDQVLNPASIVFKPGGLYEKKAVIAGYVSTISDDLMSKQLYQVFENAIKQHCTKIKQYYVGPGALHLLETGHRLSPRLESFGQDLKN
jgi:hypothetical protein